MKKYLTEKNLKISIIVAMIYEIFSGLHSMYEGEGFYIDFIFMIFLGVELYNIVNKKDVKFGRYFYFVCYVIALFCAIIGVFIVSIDIGFSASFLLYEIFTIVLEGYLVIALYKIFIKNEYHKFINIKIWFFVNIILSFILYRFLGNILISIIKYSYLLLYTCRLENNIEENEKEEIISTISNDKTISDVDEIKKFKELLEAGTITQEEYDKKKKEILNI